MTEFNEIDMFDKLSEEKFNYLLENKIDLIDLAHEDLPDEWLFKLKQYDSAALYTLSRRYFLLDKYSSRDFEYFYSQYLYLNPDISLLFCLKLQEIFIPLKNCLLNLQIQRLFYLQNK